MSIHDKKIAVIGIGCKFPGANNIDEFWDLLKNSRDSVSTFDENQLRQSGVKEHLFNDKRYVPRRGVLDNVDLFDSQLFSFSSDEIESFSAQAKNLLQSTWHALEDSGIAPNVCPKETSVYIGVNDIKSPSPELMDIQNISMGMVKDYTYSSSLASLLSYEFKLEGASMNLYTACSTSLVAVAQACNDLLVGNSDLAIAGGVSIDTPQNFGHLYNKNGIFSATGKCQTFDMNATGAVFSNGVGVVILKRLEDALKDGDNIHAVILGSAINNDSRTKPGFLAPGIKGQYACIKKAWEMAEIDPTMIDYIETHGAATVIGDPMEVYTLKKLFQAFKVSKNHKCGLGSVKTNIGHTRIASGIAGFIKAVLMLKHRAVVPSLHLKDLNPDIDIEDSPLYIPNKYQEIPSTQELMTAGVSSFGFGGTNSHLVLQSFSDELPCDNNLDQKQILTLSANSLDSLDQLIKEYNLYFKNSCTTSASKLENMCYTANCGRNHYRYRASIVFTTVDEALAALSRVESNNLVAKNGEDIDIHITLNDDELCSFVRALYKQIPWLRSVLIDDKVASTLRAACEQALLCFFQALGINKAGHQNASDCVVTVGSSDDKLNSDQVHFSSPSDLPYVLSKLWTCGVNINWQAYYQDKQVRKISLPTYPFINSQTVDGGNAI